MARQSNQKDQLTRRLKQMCKRFLSDYTVGDLALTGAGFAQQGVTVTSSGGVLLALLAVKQRSFSGFNVVAELSSSAGEGLPEHELWVCEDSDASGMTNIFLARLMAVASKLGCSSIKFIDSTSTPAESVLTEANVDVEIPNSDQLGAVGA